MAILVVYALWRVVNPTYSTLPEDFIARLRIIMRMPAMNAAA